MVSDKIPSPYIDEVYEFQGLWGIRSLCGLKAIQRGAKCIIIVTELYDTNPGTTVTNWSAQLAGELMQKYNTNPENLIFIEHTPDRKSKLEVYDETFDRVSYTWKDGKFTDPKWQRLSKQEVDKLIT